MTGCNPQYKVGHDEDGNRGVDVQPIRRTGLGSDRRTDKAVMPLSPRETDSTRHRDEEGQRQEPATDEGEQPSDNEGNGDVAQMSATLSSLSMTSALREAGPGNRIAAVDAA